MSPCHPVTLSPCHLVTRSVFLRPRGHDRGFAAGGGGVLEGTGDRQPQDERAADADFAVEDDIAAVLAEDLAADGKSQPRAARSLGAHERLEDLSLLLG